MRPKPALTRFTPPLGRRSSVDRTSMKENHSRRSGDVAAIGSFDSLRVFLTKEQGNYRARRDTDQVPYESAFGDSHRKLSSRMRSDSNRTIFVANAQRPSLDAVMCV